MSPVYSQAQRRVLAALEDIEKFDTDREFILRARTRYCTLTTSHPVEPKRCDGGADIVMRHSDIRA
ncbi:MAG: hypothetical protein E5W82_10285 [Mesorhizobium sp.]|nr:MAG: hypothetical protein E5W82_10285 [Mesorhizobium sp.]